MDKIEQVKDAPKSVDIHVEVKARMRPWYALILTGYLSMHTYECSNVHTNGDTRSTHLLLLAFVLIWLSIRCVCSTSRRNDKKIQLMCKQLSDTISRPYTLCVSLCVCVPVSQSSSASANDVLARRM